jgi:hypothetical protein
MKLVSRKRQQRFEKKERAKAFRKLVNEYDNIYWNRFRSYVDLDEPLFYGYKKYWILRDDWARSPHAAVLRKILSHINNPIYSKKKSFIRKNYLTGKSYVEEPRLTDLTEKQFEKLSLTEKKYFIKINKRSYWGAEYGVYSFKFNKGYFVSKVAKHYLTKVPLLDPDAQSRRTELSNEIFNYQTYRRKLKCDAGGGYHKNFPDKSHCWDDNRGRIKNRIADFELKEQLEEYAEENYAFAYYCHECEDWGRYSICYECLNHKIQGIQGYDDYEYYLNNY